jgi:hypothetical protein
MTEPLPPAPLDGAGVRPEDGDQTLTPLPDEEEPDGQES